MREEVPAAELCVPYCVTDEDVGWFEVSVHDVFAMKIGDGLQRLTEEPPASFHAPLTQAVRYHILQRLVGACE